MPKTEDIEMMFDSIAPDYDILNHLLSLDIDKRWRAKAVRSILDRETTQKQTTILDVACGTGDFSIAVAKHYPNTTVTGIDLSEGMLMKGRQKLITSHLDKRISLEKGDCYKLSFPDCSFDGVCVAFGVRNFEFLKDSIKEMLRVLKPGRRLVILELSMPGNRFIRWVYKIYFSHILPLIGKTISGDKGAYKYLPASVINFPAPEKFMAIMKECNADQVRHQSLSLGICRLYTATKR